MEQDVPGGVPTRERHSQLKEPHAQRQEKRACCVHRTTRNSFIGVIQGNVIT